MLIQFAEVSAGIGQVEEGLERMGEEAARYGTYNEKCVMA